MAVYSKVFYVATAALAVTGAYTAFVIYKRLWNTRTISAGQAFKLNINVVSSPEECEPLIYELRRKTMEHNAVGFDCEWVTREGKRKPVALLQLSTFDGFCVLIRLNLMDQIPPSLTNLMEDISIYKVGVAPLSDANYLYHDHGIRTMSTLDLRHFAEMSGCSVGGLAHLSETLLGVVLDKSLKVRCGNWDAEELTPAQLHYAASDAHAAIRIFVKLVNKLDKPSFRGLWCLPECTDSVWEALEDLCEKYLDYNYRHIQSAHGKENGSSNKVKTPKKCKESSLSKRYPHLKRSKPLYDNCFLQAPDNELLSTIDTRKAQWYIEKGLADEVSQDPLTVRLRFEPAGRSVGDVGKYYTLVKKNQCVVCGEKDSYIRKNVVPREYRRFFPDIMKDHSSHDVVLLCARCHQRSNMRDQAARERLAQRCGAPLPNQDPARAVEDRAAKKVKMAVRALLHNGRGGNILPEVRRQELEAIVLDYFPQHDKVTDELLQEASTINVKVENKSYSSSESHGRGVVRHFLSSEPGGLLALEELWRAHFLASMRPRHMPELWSLKHNRDKLLVKWNEGRLPEEELKAMGIDSIYLTQ